MRKMIAPLLLVAALVAGYYWLNYVDGAQEWWAENVGWPYASTGATKAAVAGSGTVEVDSVAIASELSGRVIAVDVQEGDVVTAGQVLVRLDESLLLAQQEQALAALETARANLASVSASAREEAVAAAAAELAQAESARDGAYNILLQAQARAAQPLEIDVRIAQAQGDVAVLEKEVESAQADLHEAEILRDEAGRNQSSDQAVTTYQAYAKQAEAAQSGLMATQVELQGAQEQLALLQAMRASPVALWAEVAAAQAAYAEADAAVGVAKAKLAAARVSATPEEVAVAAAQVAQAEATVARVEAQLAKTVVVSPIDGVVLERAIEPGEVASAGATLLTVADMNDVTLTVYVAESEIGLVQIGAPAEVTVDAYPGEVFAGEVTYVSMEAEFTPKNVQTREERTNLVFAVRIDLANGDHRLKAGMPADAVLRPVGPAPAATATADRDDTPVPAATPAGATATLAAALTSTPSMTLEPRALPSAAATGGAPTAEAVAGERVADSGGTPTAAVSQSETVPVASPTASPEGNASSGVVAGSTPVALPSPADPSRCADTISVLWSWHDVPGPSLSIQGTVTNYSAETLPVVLRFEVRDGLGQTVGTAVVVAFSVGPNEAHAFSAEAEDPTDFSGVELTDVSCR